MESYSKNLKKINRKLPELAKLEMLIPILKQHGAKVDVIHWAKHKEFNLPVYSISLGSENLEAPCLLIVGGVHGLERIGTKVVNSYLTSVTELLKWDESYREHLKHFRLIFVPLLNPVGMYNLTRSNGNGVDLMRNSPVESVETAQFLYGGHRISPRLPFYRGKEGVLEGENIALCKLIREKVTPSKVSIALDVHSGFGAKDRLWFPYAKTKAPFPYIAEVAALTDIFNQTYKNHVYTIEPQAKAYTTHGDIWDYVFDESLENKEQKTKLFLPLTLEMGSWAWIRKNPMQIFNPLGIFNPLQAHRRERMLRRHKMLFDFLGKAVRSHTSWVSLNEQAKVLHFEKALEKWYDKEAG